MICAGYVKVAPGNPQTGQVKLKISPGNGQVKFSLGEWQKNPLGRVSLRLIQRGAMLVRFHQ